MATVYLAHHEKHDRKVALETLPTDPAAVMGSERFLSSWSPEGERIVYAAREIQPSVDGLDERGLRAQAAVGT